ncbi:monocarboxylate transporter 12-like [Argopecten irradians]|uniref:monocarboxylate transporter 12-like n=1 Tax=Argopecten irradians TaxID=31199 RepID=UPI00371E02DA
MGICAGVLASAGLILSFFATSIAYLIATIGVVTGFGLSLAYVSITTSVGEYFTGKARFVALSFVASGSGCGAMVFPFLLDTLIQTYGWRGCLLIVGGLMGNMVVFFAVCRPRLLQKSELLVTEEIYQQTQHNQQTIYKFENRNSETSGSESFIPKCQHSFIEKLKLLTSNHPYIVFILAMCLTLPAYDSTLIYLLEYLKTKSFSVHEALLLYFFMNVGNTSGRLLPGMCKHIPHMSVLVIPALFTSLSCLSIFCLLEATTYYQHVFLMCSFGISMGGNVTTMSMTTMKLVGLENYSVGVGILMTLVGLCCTCSGAISGCLVDISGSYVVSFYGVIVCHGLGVCLFIIAVILRKYRKDNVKASTDTSTSRNQMF